MLPDLINALFEVFGGWFILLNIITLYRAKKVRGVHVLATSFFCMWGAWNIYYYPSLGQSLSFYAGIFIFIMNAVWVGQMIFYNHKEKNG